MLRGSQHTIEARSRNSAAHIGKTPWNKGTALSQEYRDKLSAAHQGNSLSPEHRAAIAAKMSAARTAPIGSKSYSHGYVLVKTSQEPDAPRWGWQLEHRVVAAEMLGRPLDDEEVVHHLDHDKQNNDPANLYVFVSQSEHARHHNMTVGAITTWQQQAPIPKILQSRPAPHRLASAPLPDGSDPA